MLFDFLRCRILTNLGFDFRQAIQDAMENSNLPTVRGFGSPQFGQGQGQDRRRQSESTHMYTCNLKL